MRVIGALLLVLSAGCATTPVSPPLAAVDLVRLGGRWHVIAHLPGLAERTAAGAYVEYRRRADGQLDYVYGSRNLHPALERLTPVPEGPTNARWKSDSSGLFADDHLILHISDDYRYLLAGAPTRERAWVLARDAQMPEWVYAGLMARLAAQGYDVAQLRRVPQ